MTEVFRPKATTLAAGLELDKQRDAAREALRGFIDKVIIPPGDGLLQVVGNLGAMLAPRPDRRCPAVRRSVMLVARARNQLNWEFPWAVAELTAAS